MVLGWSCGVGLGVVLLGWSGNIGLEIRVCCGDSMGEESMVLGIGEWNMVLGWGVEVCCGV